MISGCFCGSASGTIWSSARAVAMFSARVAFRKKIYRTIDELQTDLDAWITEYK